MSQGFQDADRAGTDYVTKIAVHSSAVVLAYAITWTAIMPAQTLMMPMLPTLATLFFLPFGIKVISAFFEGWRSILYLFPGVIIGNWFWVNMPFDAPTTYLAWMASYGTAPFIFAMIDWTTRNDRRQVNAGQAWRTMIVGGALSSVIISVLIHIIRHRNVPQEEFILSMLKYMIGDMLGLLTVLALLMCVFRFLRKARV